MVAAIVGVMQHYAFTPSAPTSVGMSQTLGALPAPLHPNLARLATIYDSIIAEVQAGRLSNEEALAQIRTLRDRDDQGVIWAIYPDGQWYRETLDGRLVPGTPPTIGIPSVTAFDVSPYGNSPSNPDNFLIRPDAPTPASAASSSRVPDTISPVRRFLSWPHRRLAVAVGSILVAAAIAVGAMSSGGVVAEFDAPVAPVEAPASSGFIVES